MTATIQLISNIRWYVSSDKKNEGCCARIVRMFDLDLLKDPAFLSMLVGMGIALSSDMSFSLLLPLIMGDYNFDTQTTAKLQAVVGAADIFSRFLTPFITRKTTLSARVAYLMSLIGLILSRFCKFHDNVYAMCHLRFKNISCWVIQLISREFIKQET